MELIRYSATVVYKDVLDEELIKNWVFLARDITDATSIAYELYSMFIGVSEVMNMNVVPVRVSEEVVLNSIRSTARDVVCGIVSIFKDITYEEFLRKFISFGGRDLKLGTRPSFELTFMSYTVEVYMQDGKCYVNTDEVVYTDSLSRHFIIRDNRVFYGF